MILEVNDTFDEKRIYFLSESNSGEDVDTTPADSLRDGHRIGPRLRARKDAEDASSAIPATSSCRLSANWPKDFHVSPFNSRKGSYSLTAYDPLFPIMTGKGAVINVITLISLKAYAKLTTRVFSMGPSIDADQLETLVYPETHCLMVVGRFCNISTHIEGSRQFVLSQMLYVCHRPQVLRGSISRHENELERYDVLLVCMTMF